MSSPGTAPGAVIDRSVRPAFPVEDANTYRDRIDRVPDAVAVHQDGRLVYVNARAIALFGAVSASELIGRPMMDLVAHDQRVGVRSRTDAARPDEAVPWKELTVLKLDGTPVEVLVSGSTVEFGGKDAIEAIFRDNTEGRWAQQALVGLNHRLELALRGTTDGAWYWDSGTQTGHMSERWYELLGYTPGEVVLADAFWERLVHPDDAEETLARFSGSLRSDDPWALEVRLRLKNGDYRWFLVCGRSVEDRDGARTRIAGTTKDIHERKLAEHKLRANEAFFSSVLDSVTAHLAVLDGDGRIVAVNKAWTRFAEQNGGLGSANLGVGADYLGVCAEGSRWPEGSADAAAVEVAIRGVLSGRQDAFEMDYECHLPNRRRWFMVRISPLLGRPGALVSHVDITARVLAAEVQRAAEERWKFALQGAGDGVYDWDLTTNEVLHSRRWWEMLGYAEHEVGPLVTDWSDGLFPEDRAPVLAVLQRHLDGLTPSYVSEHRIRRRDGSYLWVLDRGLVVRRDAQGRPLRMVGTVVDQSERRAAAMRESSYAETMTRVASAASMQDVLGAIAGGVAGDAVRIYMFDAHGWLSLEGAATFPGPSSDPDDGVIECLGEAAWTGQAHFVPNVADGRVSPGDQDKLARRGLRSYWSAPIVGEGGAVLGAVAIGFQHVRPAGAGDEAWLAAVCEVLALGVQRRWAESRLRESEQQLRAVFDQVAVGVAVVDADTGRYESFNHQMCQIVGLDEPAMWRSSLLELVDGEDHAALIDAIARPRAAMQTRVFRSDGSIAWVHLTMSPLTVAGEIVPRRRIVVLQDFTQFRAAQVAAREREWQFDRLLAEKAAAEAANRAKSEFLSTMNHELRTPLNAVLGLAEALALGVYGVTSPQQGRVLETISRSGEHLLALIDDILDVSRIDAGGLRLDLAVMPLVQVCEHAMALVESLASAKSIGLRLDCPDRSVSVEADPRRLRQVVINLLSNAIKFSDPCEIVTIEVRPSPGAVSLTVVDRGRGITAADLPRLFQPFVQLDAGLDRHHGGSGLGLALVKRLVELHRGVVSVDSVPGVGSRFSVTLPSAGAAAVVDPPQPPDPPRLLVKGGPSALAHPSVLVVDDDGDTGEMLVDFLSDVGFHCFAVARDGVEAVDAAVRQRPDIVLMDLDLPLLDGVSVIRMIRSQFTKEVMPIIAVTGQTMHGDRERVMAAGASDYLAKPMSLQHLLVVVRAALAGTAPIR